MDELIFHHYDSSPFAEKVRLIFGIMGLHWRSVIQPSVMPKPDLLPLTGGYRRIPVLQIGADIFCDTARMAQELELRFGEPSLYPQATRGVADAVAAWADSTLLWSCSRYATGLKPERWSEAFFQDRAAMWGLPPSIDRARAAAPRYREQLRAQLHWVEEMLVERMLEHERAFLLARQPGLADIAVYHGLWFLHQHGAEPAAVLDEYPAVCKWMQRMKSLGHGVREEMTPAAALDTAANAEPQSKRLLAPGNPVEFQLGRQVSVTPSDYARNPVEGSLAVLSPQSIAVRRRDNRVGDVAVHFPRVGYSLKSLHS